MPVTVDIFNWKLEEKDDFYQMHAKENVEIAAEIHISNLESPLL